MKKFILLGSMLSLFALAALGCSKAQGSENATKANTVEIVESEHDRRDVKIQIAILLDTSSSMQGLIEQAKSRLWNIVNTMTTLKYQGRAPKIEIALYEYGNDRLSKSSDYIRQILPLTSDLDLLSEKLFSLTTYGGDEYCGAVINKAVKSLDWGNSTADMKLIYIAGNEPFTQGRTSYKEAIDNALRKGIYVNTIHCGNRDAAINGMWRDGAIRGEGKFFNIDHNVRVRHIDTPYDDRISSCNERLNRTYMGYGTMGTDRIQNQSAQDANAMKISKSNYAERAVSKVSAVYDNSSWDVVDLARKDKNALAEIKQSELPKELQGKTTEEMNKVIAQKEAERKAIQKEINELAQKRQEYIDQKRKEEGETSGDDLGKAINESVLALAGKKGYTVSK